MLEKIKILVSRNESERKKLREQAEIRDKLTVGLESRPIIDTANGLFYLAKRIYEDMPNQQWDWIISDEASGRLVSLFLKKIIDRQRQKQGLSSVEINFLSGGRSLEPHVEEKLRQNLRNFLENKLRGFKPKRALIVTEYIQSGAGMEMLITALKNSGINFDIATVSITPNGAHKTKELLGDKGSIYPGDMLDTGIRLHGQTWLSGVKRDHVSGSPFPKKVKNPGNLEYNQIEKENIQGNINQARKDISLLAQNTLKIIEKYSN